MIANNKKQLINEIQLCTMYEAAEKQLHTNNKKNMCAAKLVTKASETTKYEKKNMYKKKLKACQAIKNIYITTTKEKKRGFIYNGAQLSSP